MKIIELLNAKNAFDLNCKYDGDMQLALKVVKFRVETGDGDRGRFSVLIKSPKFIT